MARPELTVRGGGIFGLSIAWAAARRGVRVRVIETAAVGAAASGGVVGAMAPHVPAPWNAKKAFQLESLLMAEGWWAAVEAAADLSPGYARAGRLQPLADAAAVAQARMRAADAARLWPDGVRCEVVPASGTWCPAPSGWALRDTLSARIAPRRALAALVAAIGAAGGAVAAGAEPGAPDDGGPTVWATGVAGLAALSADTGSAAGGALKGQAALLAHDAGDAPQIFADGLYIVPHADGTVAVGSTSERIWDDPTATDAGLDLLLARAMLACPALAGAVVLERWAGLRPRAASRAPMLGAWPGRPGQFIANGGFKIGFGMAPLVAEVMCDLVLEGRDAIPAAFRVEASLMPAARRA